MLRRILLIFLVIMLGTISGCVFKHYVPVKPLLPQIEKIRRLQLEPMTVVDLHGVKPEVIKKLQKRDAQMKDVIGRYEQLIDKYNKYADVINERSGFGKVKMTIEENK